MKIAYALVAFVALAAPAAAQYPGGAMTERMSLEAVASVRTDSVNANDPFLYFDAAATIRLTSGLDVVIRPYVRRLPGGDWDTQMYQLQVRYQPGTKIPIRVDAGIISSPLGLGTLELRPDQNPLVTNNFYYFAPLPSFDGYQDQVQLLSGGYPIGAIVSTSGERWDARAGVTDGTPARYRKIFAREGPSAMAQFVAGGGVTPYPGLRVGAGFAYGGYRRAEDLLDDPEYYGGDWGEGGSFHDESATVFNVEAEYAFHHTRLSGEWVRDAFESEQGHAVARGFYVQGVQTLTPRIFAAARFVRVSAPFSTASSPVRRARSAGELGAGYRLTPDWTLRAGYLATRSYTGDPWEHAATVSIVWAQRLF